ncbi:PREDICTED: non-specific lipid-transfer protein-like protein At2g13820 [Ipomoea nil]|uniref:non-specific lipid-transfer protein-like protein At2g13820 n=1 Tax=Ipomoea nil TaxID=35883 RepID=UPI000900AF0B|nr:PREDICTED: non-specific lipid-transfer protein-like protein At2g13820 [Ipomoea nil]
MGIKGIKMGLCFAAIMLAALIGESMVQPPDPCITVIATMLPCLPFLIADEATPTAGCCAAFSGVLLSQPNCLCAVVNGGGPVPLLNLTLALQLPYSCNVKGNDSARSPCPSSTPTAAPSPTPPSGGTNNRAPSTSQSGGNTITVMPHHIQLIASFLLVAIASDQVL